MKGIRQAALLERSPIMDVQPDGFPADEAVAKIVRHFSQRPEIDRLVGGRLRAMSRFDGGEPELAEGDALQFKVAPFGKRGEANRTKTRRRERMGHVVMRGDMANRGGGPG